MPIRKEFRHLYRGPQWKATRTAIRERAGDRCEHCHAPNGSLGYFLPNGKFIEHRKGWFPPANFPEAKLILIQCGCCHRNNVAGDDRHENLAWWCRGCHLRADRGHHRNTRATRKDQARPLIATITALSESLNLKAAGRTDL